MRALAKEHAGRWERWKRADGEAARADAALGEAQAEHHALEEDVRHSLEAGMNVHLSKPADSELLYTTLAQLIAKPE